MNDSTWTWVSGSSTTKHPGNYGVKGNASTEYWPSARQCAVGWYDSVKQEFWLFGGYGVDSENNEGAQELLLYHKLFTEFGARIAE